MDLSFERFLEIISTETKEYECLTDEIVISTANGEEIIATHIPEIKYPSLEWYEDEEVFNINLCFYLQGRENDKQEIEIVVEGLKSPKVIIEPKEVKNLINDLYSKKWVMDLNALTNLFLRYIRYYVYGYLKTHYYLVAKCGWKKIGNGREFYSLTKRRGRNFRYIEDMCGEEVLQMLSNKEDFSCILNKNKQCREFYDFLFGNPRLISIFAYTIHALTWDFGAGYEEENYRYYTNYMENGDTLFFSLCIYGKDTDKAKVIANILCNLFNVPKDNWTKIPLLHHISATSLNTDVERLRYYSSVPIIVTSKKNHIIKSSKAVTELYRYRKNMKLFVYPVYVNDAPINVDEMVNVNIDDVCLPFAFNDKEKICKIHDQATMLLVSLVCFLRNKSMKWERDKAQGAGKKHLEDAIENVGQEWVEDNLPEFLLYAALKWFCDFITEFHKVEGDKLLSCYQNTVVNIGKTNLAGQQTQKVYSNTVQEQRYLLCLHKLILDSLRKKEDWLWEGNESRGEKERCYYLDEKIWYDRFSEKLKKEKINPIGTQKIAAILKKYRILKQYKSGVSNVMNRKKKNCYVILADVFDDQINQWNTLPK